MRAARRSSPFDDLPDALRVFLSRRAMEIVGLGLMAIAGAAIAALATWSVEDPSLNHATTAPVRNLLKLPGAVAADLAMQLLGLGSVALAMPLAAWGWRLVRTGGLDRLPLRLGLWILGVGATTAMASSLPPTERWPLPTGLGGVSGDGLLHAAKMMTGIGGGPLSALIGFGFAAVAILATTAACGFGFAEGQQELRGHEGARPSRRPALDPDEVEEAHDDEPGWGIVSVGALAHAGLSLKAGLRRRWEAWRAERRKAAIRKAAFATLPPASRRQEPRFAPDGPAPVIRALPPEPARTRPAPAPPEPLPYDDEDGFDQPLAPFKPAGLDSPARPMPAAEPGPPRAAQPVPAPRSAPALPSRAPAEDASARATPPAAPSRVTPAAPPPAPSRRTDRAVAEEDDYHLPPLRLLAEPKAKAVAAVSADALEQNATLLESTLEDFGVRGEIINVRPGPVVTLYELEPAPGTKSSRVISLADDIARSMSAVSARVAVVQGRNAIGIELPNLKRETVYLRELLASQDFGAAKGKLALCLGKTIGGEPVIADLARMPHLLVAGTTGSGKSVAINTMILSLLYRLKPEECRLIMVDPKMLELSVYDGIPHLLSPVVTDPKKAVIALKWAVREMEERYKKMSKLGVRNIDGFNERVAEARAKGEVITRTVQTGFDRHTGEATYADEAMELDPLPYIVVIVDEMADLMMVAGKDIEGAIQRLAQMARAAGIHLIMATQRPSVDVITGTIKANFPTRISFQVTSKIDSRTILGEMGAEQLLGQGDMLFMAGGGRITRVHGPFCSDGEVETVVAHLKRQGRPAYLDAVTSEDDGPGGAATAGVVAGAEDGPVFDKGAFGDEGADLYDQAVAVVLRDKKASTSYIQRRLQIGYNRAASLMERMEREGIVGPANHAGKREILLETAGGVLVDDED
jgi:DNA segregation ATPase FtsK/SpoIIIE, S-DNA-T family